jgi:hypothetical protein
VAAAVLATLLVTAPAAQAAGAVHLYVPEDWDGAEHFDAGAGPCTDWAGTFHEVRHGGYDVLLPPGGLVAGEAHVNGVVNGYVELIPDDATLPTYTGTYREKTNAITIGTTPDGEDEVRIAQYRLFSTLHGTDGSSLRLELSGKVTLDARGRVTVDRDHFSCA